MSLREVFSALPVPDLVGSYYAHPIDRQYSVARAHDGSPAIFLNLDAPQQSHTARRLANLRFEPARQVSILGGSGQVRLAQVAVLECTALEPGLVDHFFRLFSAMLLGPDGRLNQHAFEESLDALITLFRALSRPGTRTVQGLWGELAILVWSAEPAQAVSSWHSNPQAIHDFSAGLDRFEVKTTTRGLREHTFRLEQLATQGCGQTVIASMMLEERRDGCSVPDLSELLGARLGAGSETMRRVERVIVESLGSAWKEADQVRYDLASARASLLVFPADRIPCVALPIPPQVKEVHLLIDLSSTDAVPVADLRSAGGLFAAVLPSA